MTKSVYIVGGAGAGKSTFTAELLDQLLAGEDMGELEDLWSKRNAKALVTLRGHRLFAPDGSAPGLYLGVWRESFPGTDGLDRASSLTGEEWLLNADLPRYILAEGATLATRRFLGALHTTTELLLVHLWADDFVKELRFAQRGSNQAEQFITGTATRAFNRWREAMAEGVQCMDLDTADPHQWARGIEECRAHLAD